MRHAHVTWGTWRALGEKEDACPDCLPNPQPYSDPWPPCARCKGTRIVGRIAPDTPERAAIWGMVCLLTGALESRRERLSDGREFKLDPFDPRAELLAYLRDPHPVPPRIDVVLPPGTTSEDSMVVKGETLTL